MEHYTKGTVQVSAWCKVCHRETMHRVDHGRRGPCLECMKKREHEATIARAARQSQMKQGDLFR
jgi:ribosomal protein L44E